MASTASSAEAFAEYQSPRVAAVQPDAVEPETPMAGVASLKTTSAATESTPSVGTDAVNMDIKELSNKHKQQQEDKIGNLKADVTGKQDAACAAGVTSTGPFGCLTVLPTVQDKEDVQEGERFLSEGTREPSGSPVPSTTGCSRQKSSGRDCPTIKVNSTSSNSSVGDDSSSARSDNQSTKGNNDQSAVLSANVELMRVSLYNEEAASTGKNYMLPVATTKSLDLEREALSTGRQTQRAQHQNEENVLPSSLHAVQQHRYSVLAQENRDVKEVPDLATHCVDREALAPKIPLLKEQPVAREQQHHPEKRELAAAVKALLSASKCENKKERADVDSQPLTPQRDQWSRQIEEKHSSVFCPQSKPEEVVGMDNDEKQHSKIREHRFYVIDGKKATQQQRKQLQDLPSESCIAMEKRRTPKSASTVGSAQHVSHEKEARTASENAKERLSPAKSTAQSPPSKEPPSVGAALKEAPKTVEAASKEVSSGIIVRCEHKSKSVKEVEQPLQQQSKQQRQATDEEKDSTRRPKKNGSWWRQQVVNRLRLPGPNLTRKQFLSTFHHPGDSPQPISTKADGKGLCCALAFDELFRLLCVGKSNVLFRTLVCTGSTEEPRRFAFIVRLQDQETGLENSLLNDVFDRLKVTLRTNDGGAEEVVTTPRVLDLLEKTNGPNILHTLDAAELLEANVRCIDRKMASQKTDLQVFAIRLMCRFFLALSKKTLGELEMTCRRVAPREAVRTYTEELENYRQTLIKATAAERNISIDQSTVVVSKCIHNMRMELQNDLVMLQRALSETPPTQSTQPMTDLTKCRAQALTVENPVTSEGSGVRPLNTKLSTSARAACKLGVAASPPAASSQAATLPSVFSYGAVRHLAAPDGSSFTGAEYQAPKGYMLTSTSHAGTAAAAAYLTATGIRYGAPGVLSSQGPLISTTLSSSAACSASPPSFTSAARATVLPAESAEVQRKGKVSAPVIVCASADNAVTTTELEVAGKAAPQQINAKGMHAEREGGDTCEEKFDALAVKLPATAAAPAGTGGGCTTPVECLSQRQTRQKEKNLSSPIQIIEYRYADGTPVTNAAHLPEGAKAAEAAARARLEETARVTQEAARRAEAAALAQFAAVAGGSATAASVAASQYQRALAAPSSSQESVHHDGSYLKLSAETDDSANRRDSLIPPMSSTVGAPPVVTQEEQQPQQVWQKGQQTVWKPQQLLAPTAVGGILRPLPAAVVAAAAVRRPAASQPAHSNGAIEDAATAEGAVAQKGDQTTGARLQHMSSFRLCTAGEYGFPSTDRGVPFKDPAAPSDYSAAAAGIVPPGFPPGTSGQLHALLQHQRLLTAMPSMVVPAAKPCETKQPAAPAPTTTKGASHGRVSRSLTPKATERDSFMRRSRGGCMGGSPHRKSKRRNNSSSRTASVSSIQRAAGRFFASLGLWRSDGEEDEEDTASAPEAVPQTHDGLAAATEQYLNGQKQKLQQQRQEQALAPQQLSLQYLQQQKLQQQMQQQMQQQHLQQQLQHQQLRQQLQQVTVAPGAAAFPAGLPFGMSTTCEGPMSELLSKQAAADAPAGGVGICSMGSDVPQHSLQHYVAHDAAEHLAADPRVHYSDTTAKNFAPAYSAAYAQHHYRLAQQQEQQRQQQRQQQQQQQQRSNGEAWISTQSFLSKDVPGGLHADQNISSQQRTAEKRTAAASTAATAVEKRFTATMESILAEAGEEEMKAAAATGEKRTDYLVPPQQKEFIDVQLETHVDQQRRDRQQSYTAGTEFADKKTTKQQLQQAFLQQQRGMLPGGYNQTTSRDTSVVTTHIPPQVDSPNTTHAVPVVAYIAGERTVQQTESCQTMTPSTATGQEATAGGARICQQAVATTAAHPTISSSYAAPAVASSLQAQQHPEQSKPVLTAFSAAAGLGAPAASRTPQQPELSNTVALSSCGPTYAASDVASSAAPRSVVRSRVSSIAEVPSPQLGTQQIGNFAQVQAQLDSLTQRQIEAYAQRYGLYSSPQAAAAALGGVPLVGVGALAGPPTCNGYAQFLSQHRPLPPLPANYVFTKSS